MLFDYFYLFLFIDEDFNVNYNNIFNNVTGATKRGNTDTQVNTLNAMMDLVRGSINNKV